MGEEEKKMFSEKLTDVKWMKSFVDIAKSLSFLEQSTNKLKLDDPITSKTNSFSAI
jgi:capsular polysaccharide biosynthesis protein